MHTKIIKYYNLLSLLNECSPIKIDMHFSNIHKFVTFVHIHNRILIQNPKNYMHKFINEHMSINVNDFCATYVHK